MKPAETISEAAGILQIHWCFPPTTGGVESHVADLARIMASRQRHVVVLTGERDPVASGHYQLVATDLLNLEHLRSGALQAGDVASGLFALLARLVDRHRISVIHGHNLHHFHSGPALAVDEARRRLGVQVFHTFHETWPDILAAQPVYRQWDGNYAPSLHIQQQCRAMLGFSPALRRLGIDTSSFRPERECFFASTRPVILHPARLLPWKGVEISVRALFHLLGRGLAAKLVLTDTQQIADWNRELSDYRSRVLRLIDELELSAHVEFVTASYRDMPRLYDMADIVVYPTIGEEPYGLVPIEAMSCARPIIATESGGMSETIVDGVTGYLVPRGDAAALAGRLEQLIADPGMARRMGSAGRDRVLQEFDAADYAASLLESFDRAGNGERACQVGADMPALKTSRNIRGAPSPTPRPGSVRSRNS